jgi:hypothetical protein
MELLAAAVGAGLSLTGVVLTLWWTARTEHARFKQERLEEMRGEKRRLYAEILRAWDLHRAATLAIGEKDNKSRDWTRYYATREKCLEAGAELQLTGTYEMFVRFSSALVWTWDVAYVGDVHHQLDELSGSAFRFVMDKFAEADPEIEALRDEMRVDLGYPPLDLKHARESARTRPGA